RFDLGLLRVRPSTEMNSETLRPTPPRRFSSRRNETSVTPAIGERINGGLISIFRILNGLTSVVIDRFPSLNQGLIVTAVPSGTAAKNSLTSSFSNATQPHVQSLPAPFP